MYSALLSLALWSGQLCCGNIAVAKTTNENVTCKTPGNTIYVVNTTGTTSCMHTYLASLITGAAAVNLQAVATVTSATVFADASPYLKLSAAIAAGLVNRHMQAPAVFNLLLPADEAWLKSLQAEEPSVQNCMWKPITALELWQLADSTGDVHKSCKSSRLCMDACLDACWMLAWSCSGWL